MAVNAHSKWRLSRILAGACALVLLASGLGGCTTNPATGKSQFNMLSRAEEIQIGEDAKPQLVEQYGGRIDDPYMQAYVTEVGMSMVPYVEGDYGELPWEFIVLDSEVINAFALPGGKVFITKGLLQELEDEAMLAGVLGHEIGHVTAEHADKRISNQLILSGVVIGATVAAGVGSDDDLVQIGVPILVGVGGQGFLLKFGRNDELQADSLGMRYMSRAGYDPEAQRDVMQVLENASGGGADSAGGSRPPEILSTHPYPETRIKRIDRLLEENYPPEMRASLARDRIRFEQRVLSQLPED